MASQELYLVVCAVRRQRVKQQPVPFPGLHFQPYTRLEVVPTVHVLAVLPRSQRENG